MESAWEEIVTGLNTVLKAPAADVSRATELTPLLAATQARAVGCWKQQAGELHLAGFLAVDDMPAAVQADFVSATRKVALTQTQLGIVQAATLPGPALNHRAEDPLAPAAGSIGWLARFEAASSLAVPIFRGDELVGALAVATARRIEPNDAVWQLVTQVASHLS